MDAIKHERAKATAAYKAQEAARAVTLKPINDVVKAKDFKKAFSLMDKLFDEHASYKTTVDYMRFKILLDNYSSEEVIAFGNEWIKTGKLAAYRLISEIANKENLSKETYLWAANSFVTAGSSPDRRILNFLATCFEKGGDIKKAKETMEKAAEIGRNALNNPAMAGAIDEATVSGYEKRGKELQNKLN